MLKVCRYQKDIYICRVINNNTKTNKMKATEKLKELKAQLKYVIELLNNELQNWERREWLSVKCQYESEINELELHINHYNL